MLIYLDSNIICSNYYMTGPSFEVVQKVGTIVFGQIVVDEVCNKFKENLIDQLEKTKNEINNLNRLLPESPVHWKEIDISDEYKKYKAYLDWYIIENNMPGAEDYPKDGHPAIVQRALHRKKPFKSDGSTGWSTASPRSRRSGARPERPTAASRGHTTSTEAPREGQSGPPRANKEKQLNR